MPDMENLTGTWSAGVVLAADTMVQAQDGRVAISTQAPGTQRGIHLAPGDAMVVASGKTLYARALSNPGITALSMEEL